MKKWIYILTCTLSVTLYGQKNDPEPDIIQGVTLRSVEPSYRISSNPTIIDTTLISKIHEYPLLSLQHPTRITVDTIKAVNIKTEQKLPQLYNTYVKIGVGTELMPLGEIYFDSKRNRKFVYGAHLQHLSSFGNFKNYAPAQFDRTKLGLYGALNEKKYSLSGNLHYKSNGFHYYGWQIPTDSVDRKSIAQRYQDLGFSTLFSSHKKDSATLNYTTGIDYNHYASKKPQTDSLSDWRARENYFAINSSGFYKYGSEIYALDFNIRYNGYKYGNQGDTTSTYLDSGLVRNNTIINLKPTITTYLQNNRLKATVGLDFVVDAVPNNTKVHIYPAIEAKYSLFNDIFIPYAGLNGGLKQITFKSLSTENEFILPNQQLQNENTALNFYGGIKGTISKQIGFNVSASFANVKNKALFITDTLYYTLYSVRNKFSVIYDTVNITTLEGSIYYQAAEKLKIDVTGRYFSYMCRNNAYAWNLPQWKIMARTSYNLYDKLIANIDLNFEGGRRALVYTNEDNTTFENEQYAKKLGLIADINLSLEYRYNKRISVFLQTNNLAAQRYNRWYNYPVQAFQLMGGFTARF